MQDKPSPAKLFLAANKIHHQFYHKLFIIGIALFYQQLEKITYMLTCFELVGISD
jgi:hypothetical protein